MDSRREKNAFCMVDPDKRELEQAPEAL